jgi:hypothetical protein
MAQAERSRLTPWLVAAALLVVFGAFQWRHGDAIAATSPEGDARVVAVLSRARRAIAPDTRVAHVGITAVLGTGVLDLRDLRPEPGAVVVVEMLGVAGALRIRVPDGWVVDTMTVPVLGTLQDDRRPSARVDPEPGGAAPRLVLRGALVMGRLTVES